MSSKPQPPCKDCEFRHLGCHSTCEPYKDFEAEKARYYKEREKNFAEIDRYKTKFRKGQR